MKTLHLLSFLLLFVVLACHDVTGQTRDARLRTQGYINPDEVVTIDSSWTIEQSLRVLNEMSKKHAGKIIVDTEKRNVAIGMMIVNQHWRDALEVILSSHGLWYVEEPEYIRIVPTEATGTALAGGSGETTEPPPSLGSQDVKISAVFFNANISKMQEYGISWNFFRAKKQNESSVNAMFSSGIGSADSITRIGEKGAGGEKGLMQVSSPPSFTFANIDALVRFFGTNDLGEVITSPEVVVRNAKKGTIQIGKNIFIATRDIAGNTVNQEYPTGTIIEVTPTVYTEAETNFVYLDIKIEQSDVAAGPTINQTAVNTHALLYDGEETVIGGLYTTFDSKSRDGIPYLKDLPWWFLGLRYIFGSESIIKTKQELIVLLKVELLKPIRDRIAARGTEENLLEKKRAEYKLQYEKK